MNFKSINGAISAMLALVVATSASGQCQEWKDGPLTAPNPNANGQVLAMTVWDTDGAGPAEPSLVIGGTFTQVGGVNANRVALWNGWHWIALGTGCNNTVHSLGVFNGQLIAGGDFTTAGGVSASRIARWTGTSWLPLGSGTTGGSPAGRVSALTVFSGALIAGGSFTSAGGVTVNCIARWNGSSWSALGSGMTLAGNFPRVHCLAVFNSQLYAGGFFDSAGGTSVNNIARWNGSSWSKLGLSFGGNGADGLVRALAVHTFEGDASPSLIVGGSFSTVSISNVTFNTPAIARWSGSTWGGLAGGLPGATVAAIVEHSDGLVVGGFFPGSFNSIARYDDADNAWSPLDGGGVTSGSVQAMAVYDHRYAGDYIVVGGGFTSAGGHSVSNIIKLFDSSEEFQPMTYPMIPDTFTQLGSSLVVAGSGSQLTSGGVANNILLWDGVQMSPLGGGLNGWVNTMTTKPGAPGTTELVIGGFFSQTGSSPAVAANNIVMWNQASTGPSPGWSAMGPGFDSVVWATTVFRGRHIAGGRFTHSGSTVVNGVAEWNGSAWTPFTSGITHSQFGLGQVFSLTSRFLNTLFPPPGISRHELIVAGSFTHAGGIAANNIAAWWENVDTHGEGWLTFGTGFNDAVITVAMHGNSLYAGGVFTHSGDGATPLLHVARWTGSAWVQVGAGLPGTCYQLHSSGGLLYATQVAAVGQSGLMKWDGTTWSPVPGGFNNDPIHNVFGVGTYHDELHISGYLSSTATAPVRLVDWTRYLTTGAPWIAAQPTSTFALCRGSASFTLQPAAGYTGLSYSWRKDGEALVNGITNNGVAVSGATSPSLVLTNVSPMDEGVYDCLVANSCGSATSNASSLSTGTCCSDINHNELINIDDLVQVIVNWGFVGSSPADVTHDGVVNIDDLVMVITNWGACP